MAEKILKKAVIATGGKQYLVTEGEELSVESISSDKNLSFSPLMVIDGSTVKVGTPEVDGVKVTAEVLEQVKADKVTSIRYKAKKRVRKVRGHRQLQTKLKILKIA